MREDESDPFRFAELRQILECIHGCTVDRRYAPHPENETFCEIRYHDVLNRIRRAKEERSCDLVYTDFQRQLLQMFIHRRGIIVHIDPAVGVRPPFLIFAAVLAIAPVAGIPPKSAEAIFPAPCAISSVSERCLLLIMPSATTQERSDSIAASTAIVNAFGIAD